LAGLNAQSEKLIGVEDVLKNFWNKYGRNYYRRFDYESIPDEIGNKVWARIEGEIKNNSQKYVNFILFRLIKESLQEFSITQIQLMVHCQKIKV